ncbi:hypothetical protein E0H22_16075 [Rhodopseudomonas boonkerdii]|uniref:hypothetical protein n=1 Tax=Rhodopseudomonas boonkerdii TaxID=475937 RepID=UPI001E3C20B2|nr:hypothetical protein [Rhodopseudomonas boonkerdii]UGV27069.1 hypothetical protein E0H22_16075 [Rhodopseudomonas boonkerdii]
MLEKIIILIGIFSAGSALAEESRQSPAPFPPGQSVTGPASEQSVSGNASANASRNKAAKPSTSVTPEKADGQNGGESGFSREETPGVNSSATNSF